MAELAVLVVLATFLATSQAVNTHALDIHAPITHTFIFSDTITEPASVWPNKLEIT